MSNNYHQDKLDRCYRVVRLHNRLKMLRRIPPDKRIPPGQEELREVELDIADLLVGVDPLRERTR